MFVDYKKWPFSPHRVLRSGINIGKYNYSKLFLIENCLRIIINTVLSVQIGPDWWDLIMNPKKKKDALKNRDRHYKRLKIRPSRSAPWNHGIYHIFLSDLKDIAEQNSHLIEPILKDIYQYIIDLENTLGPRNFICHMNYPPNRDRALINNLYEKTQKLLTELEKKIPLNIP